MYLKVSDDAIPVVAASPDRLWKDARAVGALWKRYDEKHE